MAVPQCDSCGKLLGTKAEAELAKLRGQYLALDYEYGHSSVRMRRLMEHKAETARRRDEIGERIRQLEAPDG